MKRIDLYKLIWKESLSKLSTQFNIEEYTLRKIIKEQNIPRPKSAYWTKLKHSKKVDRTALEGPPDEFIDIDDYREKQYQSVRYRSEQLTEQIIQEHAKELLVPKNLKNKHPLIIRAKKELEDRSSNMRSQRLIELYSGYLSIAVQKSNISRFLRIIETFIYVLELRGHSVGRLDSDHTEFNISDETMKIKFRETCVRRDDPDDTWVYTTKILVPTNKLTIRSKIYWKDKHWSDGYDPLENQLAKIIAHLEVKAEDLKAERIQREIENRKEEHLRKLENLEIMRKQWEQLKVEKLVSDASKWHKAEHLQRFLDRIKSYENKTAKMEDWVNWASRIVNQNDPLNTGFQEYIDSYEFDEQGAKERLELV